MEKELSEICQPVRRLLIFGISCDSKIADLTILRFLHFFKLAEKGKCKLKEEDLKEKETGSVSALFEKMKFDSAESSEVRSHFDSISSFIKNLTKQEEGHTILNSLELAATLPYSSKECIVLCLAILAKSEDKSLATEAYSAVPHICTSSYLLFLFIQCCKILLYENRSSGWGRGLRRAVHNFYLRWDPYKLALEITRCPRAFTWSHPDIIRLAHIKLGDFPEGTQAVLHCTQRGIGSAIKEYADKTPEIIDFLKSLYPSEDKTSPSTILKRGNFILEKSSNLSLSDFPTVALNTEIWTFALKNAKPPLITEALLKSDLLKAAYLSTELRELLIKRIKEDSFSSENSLTDLAVSYNACRKKAIDIKEEKDGNAKKKEWKLNAQPAPDKGFKLSGPKILPEQLNLVIDALGQCITSSMEKHPKTKKPAAVFIDMSPSMRQYFSVCFSDPPGDIRADQAATLILQSIAPEKWETITPYFFTKSGPGTMFVPSPCGIHYLKTNMKNIVPGPVDVKAAMTKSLESKKDSCIILCRTLTKKIVTDSRDAMTALKEDQKIRLIVCEMSDLHIGEGVPNLDKTNPDLCFICGFSPKTIGFIKAFHERII